MVALGNVNVLSSLGLARFGYAMILPAMKDGLRLSYAETGWLATGHFIGYLVSSFVAGLMATRWAPRRLILISLLCLAGGLAATGVVTDFVSALLARTVTGLASGAVYIPSIALTTFWFAPHRRGMAAGLQTGGSGFGLILSGLLVPEMLRRFGPEGWRHSWVILGLVVGVVWMLGLAFARNRPEDVGHRPYGAMADAPPPLAGPAHWGEVFVNPALWGLGALFFCFGFSYVIYATFFAAYLVGECGFSPAAAGQLWGLVGILSISSGLLSGTMADRIGKHSALAVVFGGNALCFAVFAVSHSSPTIVASAILFGLAGWGVPTIMAAAAGDHARPSLAAAALGSITIMSGLGQAIGPPIAGALADRTHSFSESFLLASAVSLIGCIGSVALRPRSRQAP
jgi:MFS family permease